MTNTNKTTVYTAYTIYAEYKPIKPKSTPPTRKSPAPTPRTAEAHKIKIVKCC